MQVRQSVLSNPPRQILLRQRLLGVVEKFRRGAVLDQFAEPGADWNRLSTAGANLSLFASRRLVELRIPTGKPGTEGAKAIAAWCARLPEDATTLVLLPELDWQQQKAAWFNALESTGVLVEARAVTRDELADRILRQVAIAKRDM